MENKTNFEIEHTETLKAPIALVWEVCTKPDLIKIDGNQRDVINDTYRCEKAFSYS
jgi:hypothetical protein